MKHGRLWKVDEVGGGGTAKGSKIWEVGGTEGVAAKRFFGL